MGLLRTGMSSAGNVADAARPANYEPTFEGEREESLRIVPETVATPARRAKIFGRIAFEKK